MIQKSPTCVATVAESHLINGRCAAAPQRAGRGSGQASRRRRIGSQGALGALLALLLALSAHAVDNTPIALTSPLVPFNMCMGGETTNWQTSLCTSIGYSGIVLENITPSTLTSFASDPEVQAGRVRVVAAMYWWNIKNPIPVENLDSSLDQLAKLGAVLWVVTDSDTGRTTASINNALPGLRIIADRCAVKGVQMVLYPHGGTVYSTAVQAAQMVTSMARPAVKISLVLCHELNDAKALGKTIAQTDVILTDTVNTLSSQIALVCISGADQAVDPNDFSTTIKPLDQGTYDMRPAVLRTLASRGYAGPMILHTYNLITGQADHLARSFATWNSWIVPVTTPAPTISTVSPATGPVAGGTAVTITGTNFTGTTSVLFGSTPATSMTVVNPTTVTCVAPVRNASGPVGVVLSTIGRPAAKVGAFTYTAPAPTITSLSATTGPAGGGTAVTITGTNLLSTNMVTFGGTLATSVVANSQTTVSCVAPAHAVGAVSVVLTASGGKVTKSGAFTYLAAPTISSLSPTSGPVTGGTSVTIRGANLSGTSTVSFGGVAVASWSATATEVAFLVPPHAAGAVSVVLTTPGGTVTKSSAFTYVASTVPTITNVSATSGPVAGGTSVTINGTNLTGTSAVSFGGVAVQSFSEVDAGKVTCVAPAHAAGVVDVVLTTPAGVATAPAAFTYVASVPTIISLSPVVRSTSGGALVTIMGTNLTGTSAVSFGGTAAKALTVVNAATVTCEAPAHAAGAVDVVLTTPDGVATATGAFTYVVVPTGTGTVARQIWTGIAGKEVALIPLATAPTSSDTLTALETTQYLGDSYGARIRGYLTAPYTGSYVFWIAGDDTCVLRLGTGESAASKVQLSAATSSTGYRNWTRMASQKSIPVALVAGNRYFIEVLLKENTGNDYVSVGWSLPGDATTAPSGIVPGSQLSPYLPAAAPTGLIATLPAGGKAALAWTDAASTETGFRVERRTGTDGTWTVVATTAAGATSYVDVGLTAGTTYGYRVAAVSDDGDLAYGAELTVAVPAAPPAGSGSISRDIWTAVTGSSVANIPLGTVPTSSDTLASLEEGTNGLDSFGTRLRGYITAPYTGSYTFWIAGDDACALYLGTDERVAGKTLIASSGGSTQVREWTRYASQKSAAIALVAGRRYYVEVLHKENTGNEHLAVGWARPGDDASVPAEIVPGSQLSPYLGDVLPSPWLTRDIGAVGLSGAATLAADESWAVAGSGADIWSVQDAFRFVYQPVTGDFRMTARVVSQPNTNAWAKAGLMARGGLAANVAFSMLAITPNFAAMQYRLQAGAGCSNATISARAPYWLRLVRSGDVWTASASPDGVAWTQVGPPVTIVLGTTVQLGLAVTSHDNTKLGEVRFDDVEILPAGTN